MTLNQVGIVPVLLALGAPEPKGNRLPAWFRNGDGLSISIDTKKNCWFDFVAGRGGGIIDLVMVARDCSKSEALRWLEQNAGLDSQRLTHDERERRARAQRHAARVAQGAEDFVHGLRLIMVRHRDEVAAAIIWFLKHDVDPPAILDLVRINRAIAYLDKLQPRELVQFYIGMGADDPKLQSQLVGRGRADRERAELVTSAVVELLAA